MTTVGSAIVANESLRSRAFSALREDGAKLPAFFRRDLLTLWSYRAAFFADWANMIVQVLVFYFLNRFIPSRSLPSFGGKPTTYLDFVTVGLLLTSFIQITMSRLVSSVRNEQLMGTLESLLVTPTAPMTLQFGQVVYDLLYSPLRTAVFVILMTGVLGARFHFAGLLPTVVVFAVFTPFMWGIGLLSAAAVLTFKRGGGAVGIGVTGLILGSGAYFPVSVFPGWLQALTAHNPVTIAIDASRQALLGAAGWSTLMLKTIWIVPFAVVSLAIGLLAFRVALARERRRGTLGLY
jgi:ABC-2 type transport system permease protein